MMRKNENGNIGTTSIRILIIGDRNVGKSGKKIVFF